MCIICVELMKQRLTYREAESASREMVVTAEPQEDVSHYKELKESLESGDFDKLGEILDESGKDYRSN